MTNEANGVKPKESKTQSAAQTGAMSVLPYLFDENKVSPEISKAES